MEVQDGITVRPMRLKVLYTFDDQNKTNCLARWPHLLDIQTAYLDENTQIGVIELKTCIQAIVSASPELVAKLGQDYTVYAYDYSEYETPLVGQGMLSWVLASASTTPNAPAHQSKTIVTGRVSKNVLGLFSKGAQETLEVKLRLVPVPTVMQSEYLESMQRYRELSNVIPEDFDAQAWSSFVQQNPHIFAHGQRPRSAERSNGSRDHSGIEKFHRLLSESSTPREFPSAHPDSAAPSPVIPPSRCDSPVGTMQNTHQFQQQSSLMGHKRRDSDASSIRPSSRASVREVEFPRPGTVTRRGSTYSGYGSGDEAIEHPPRKRARLFRADLTGKDDMNIERQPGSLRVAASTAASVRIHRPTPITSSHHPSASGALEEPVRPPTPISRTSNEGVRRSRPPPSLLRESSVNSTSSYKSPYPYEDEPSTDLPTASPDDHRYQGIFESQFNMPSSPPITDGGFHSRSSPVLPPLPIPPDSGFMSATLEDLMDEEGCLRTNPDGNHDTAMMVDCDPIDRSNQQPATSHHTSPANDLSVSVHRKDNVLASDGAYESMSSSKEPPALPPQHSSTASRPSSRTSIRPAQRLAPAPISQSEIDHLINSIPASDPIIQPQGFLRHTNSWSGPMSDLPLAETPSSHPVEDGKGRSGTGARRVRQVQARLESCIREGQIPPYCNNCGAIETPTWRRAWSKDFGGSEQEANDFLKDPQFLFWTPVERDDGHRITKFRLYKKTLVDTDKDFDQILLCNPCGLWLQKFKSMRPQNKWNKQPAKDKRKRPARPRKGPLSSGVSSSTRSRSRSQMNLPTGSSPARTDSSSPACDNGSQAGEDDDATPAVENENENSHDGDELEHAPKRTRASSAEPTRSSGTLESRWDENTAIEALKRAIQSSPARNLDARTLKLNDENLTPKPVRRALFPNNHDGPLKTLGESLLNSPRRSPRVGSRGSEKPVADKENNLSATNHSLDDLFESPSFDFTLRNTPTPKRRTPRSNERRLSLPFCSPSASKAKDATVVRSLNTTKSGEPRSASAKGGSPGGTAEEQNAFPGMDNNLFDPWQSLPQSDMYIPFSDWSPTAVNGDSMLQFPDSFNDDEALINALLSEPELHKEADVNAQFPDGVTTANATLPDAGRSNTSEAQNRETQTGVASN